MPSIDSLPPELHLEILSLLSTATLTSRPRKISHPFTALSLTCRALRSSTLLYCESLLSRLGPTVTSRNVPAIPVAVRQLSKLCIFCGKNRFYEFRNIHPSVQRCMRCSRRVFPALNLTTALERYRLRKFRIQLIKELNCEIVPGGWGKMYIYLVADLEAFAERVYGHPIEQLMQMKAERSKKLEDAKRALRVAREEALKECCTLNGVEFTEKMALKVEAMMAMKYRFQPNAEEVVTHVVREEILKRKMREAGYEHYRAGILAEGKWCIPGPLEERCPYPDARYCESCLVGASSRSLGATLSCRYPSQEFLRHMFFREFNHDSYGEPTTWVKEALEEPLKYAKCSYFSNLRDPRAEDGRVLDTSKFVTWVFKLDAFYRPQSPMWDWASYPVLVLRPFWLCPAMKANRGKKWLLERKLQHDLRNKELVRDWEDLKKVFRNTPGRNEGHTAAFTGE